MKELSWGLTIEILKTIWSFIPTIILFLLLLFVFRIPHIIKYKNSEYKNSGTSLFKFLFDKGVLGEGLTFMILESIPVYSKTLANVYIPTEDGTTEIDVIHITKSGVYVIESKNYTGWIFGSSNMKYWTSVIYQKKYRFYNPIWQNKKHIKYVQNILKDVKLKSLIVFSERCKLKKLNLKGEVVIKRNILERVIKKDLEREAVLTNEQIEEIYNTLKQYANKTNEEKQAHIKRLEMK